MTREVSSSDKDFTYGTNAYGTRIPATKPAIRFGSGTEKKLSNEMNNATVKNMLIIPKEAVNAIGDFKNFVESILSTILVKAQKNVAANANTTHDINSFRYMQS